MAADNAPMGENRKGMKLKIDLVYLWVDGNDPKWLDKKNAAIEAAGILAPKGEAVAAKRFFDNDELKYSLRGVEKFAPWINHIFVVTDGQTPKWMNPQNQKISVVDIAAIVPRRMRPCFNSALIELYLTNIPGLSEYFIYANDDMFIGGPIKPEFFFHENGRPIIRAQRRSIHKICSLSNKQYDEQIMNAKKLIYKIYGKNHDYRWHPAHNMDPYRRSHLIAATQHPKIKPALAEMAGHQFRHNCDIQRSLFHEYMIANNLADIRIYSRIRQKLFPECVYANHAAELERMRKRPQLFCINDAGSDAATDKFNHDFLEKTFPKKSKFEK